MSDNIDIEIEIRRALHKTYSDTLVMKLLSQLREFYCKLFFVCGLDFTPEVVKQKRQFLVRATEYYLIKSLPKSYLKKDANRYMFKGLQYIPKMQEHIADVTEFVSNCGNMKSLEERYSLKYHVKKESLVKYLAVNREDNLSDLAKAIEKIYYNEDGAN